MVNLPEDTDQEVGQKPDYTTDLSASEKIMVDNDARRTTSMGRNSQNHPMYWPIESVKYVTDAWKKDLMTDGEMIGFLKTIITEMQFSADKTHLRMAREIRA